jgi:hypothetical protein
MITRDDASIRKPTRPPRFGAGVPTKIASTGAPTTPRSLGEPAVLKPFSPHTVSISGVVSNAMPDKLRRATTPVTPQRPATAGSRLASSTVVAGGTPLSPRRAAQLTPRSPPQQQNVADLSEATRRTGGGGSVRVHSMVLKGSALDAMEQALVEEARRRDAAEVAMESRQERSKRCIRHHRFGGFASEQVNKMGGYVLHYRQSQLTATALGATSSGIEGADDGTPSSPLIVPRSNAGMKTTLFGEALDQSARLIGRRGSTASSEGERGGQRFARRRSSNFRRLSTVLDDGGGRRPVLGFREIALVFPNVAFILRRKAKHVRAALRLRELVKGSLHNAQAVSRAIRRRYFMPWSSIAKARITWRHAQLRRPWIALKDWTRYSVTRRQNLIGAVENILFGFRLKRIMQVWFRHAFVANRVRIAHSEKAIAPALVALQLRLFAPPSSRNEAAAMAAFEDPLETAETKASWALAGLDRRMSRAERHRRSFGSMATATWTHWTDLAVNNAYLREVAHGNRREHWPYLRRVLWAWREVTSLARRESADYRKLELWRESRIAGAARQRCWIIWRTRMHEASSSALYRTSLQRHALRQWRHRFEQTQWTVKTEQAATQKLDRRRASTAFFQWRKRFDQEKLLEALQAASFVPHAHRLRHYGAYFLDRPQDNNYLLVHRRFHDWRYFIKRRRAWEAFVSQQHVEFNNALKRRALVVWRARGRVCWASGLTAPGYDHAAYMATKPSAGATSTNLRPPNFSMTGTFSRSAGGTMYDAASSVGDVASYIRGGNAGAMTSLSITAGGTFNTTFEATGTRGWLRSAALAGTDRETANMTSVSMAARSVGMNADLALGHLQSQQKMQPLSVPLPYHGYALPQPNGRLWSLAAPMNYANLRAAEAGLRQCDDVQKMPSEDDLVALRLPSLNDAFGAQMNGNAVSIAAQIRAVLQRPKDVRAAANRHLFGVEKPVHPPYVHSDDDDDDPATQDVHPTPFAGFLMQRVCQAVFMKSHLRLVWLRTHASLTQRSKEQAAEVLRKETMVVLAALADADQQADVSGPTGARGGAWSALAASKALSPVEGADKASHVHDTASVHTAAPPKRSPGRSTAHVFQRSESTVLSSGGGTSTKMANTSGSLSILNALGSSNSSGGGSGGRSGAAGNAVFRHFPSHVSEELVALSIMTPREVAIRNVATRKLSIRKAHEREQRDLCISNAFMLCRSELPMNMFNTIGIGTSTSVEPVPALIAAHLRQSIVRNAVDLVRCRMLANAKGLRASVAISAGNVARQLGLAATPKGLSTKWQARPVRKLVDSRGRKLLFFDGTGLSRTMYYRLTDMLIEWRCRVLERVLMRAGRSRLLDVATEAGLQCLRRQAEERRKSADAQLQGHLNTQHGTTRMPASMLMSQMLVSDRHYMQSAMSPRSVASPKAPASTRSREDLKVRFSKDDDSSSSVSGLGRTMVRLGIVPPGENSPTMSPTASPRGRKIGGANYV